MKKQFFISSALLLVHFCFSQNTFPTGNGTNVGIGTLTPTEKLEVVGTIKSTKGVFTNSLPNNQNFSSYDERAIRSEVFTAGTLIHAPSNSRSFTFHDYPSSNYDQNPQVAFYINDRNAMTRLMYTADANSGSSFRLSDKNENVYLRVNDSSNNDVSFEMPKTNSRIVIGDWGTYLPQHKLVVRGSSKIEGNILTDANIGIGTSSFSDGTDTYRLSVNGAVRAHRVKVYTTWADFVFEDNYKLPTLQEVENHIKQNGHLKDIPSAKQVEQDGIELGEMNKLLLQKVEELTLYLIEMDKEIKDLKQELKSKK